MFYMNHTLCDSTDKRSYFHKCDLLRGDKLLNMLLAKASNNHLGKEIEKFKITNLNPYIIVTILNNNETSKLIRLYTSINGYTRELSQVTLSTVPSNCGVIHISNVYSYDGIGTGIGWELLLLAEEWCRYAGYTLLFGNTAGYEQNKLIPKFEALGYETFGPQYINSRSANRNIWLYKIISNQELLKEVTGEDECDDDDEYDGDEEEY